MITHILTVSSVMLKPVTAENSESRAVPMNMFFIYIFFSTAAFCEFELGK